ncbi:hypothetical protein [Caudoviricetes sp.]|nr:hypothetical protein [Caudoviricetes sp.]
MNLGDVLYDNVFRKGTLAYSGTVTSGFEKENAVDWRDFSFFAPSSGTTALSVALTAGQSIDTACIWVGTLGGLTAITVDYESAPSVFTTLATISSPVVGFNFVTFASVAVATGRQVRVNFVDAAGTSRIRQVTVGPRLTFPIGEWVDKTPHALQSGLVMDNIISMNGSIIARNVRRVEKSGAINLEYLTEAWVRTYWEPFITHAINYPFWYRWSPRDYANDVIFAAAQEIQAPKNGGEIGRMTVGMPFKGITG